MDREMLQNELEMAERHVLEGEHHVARQREIVAELARDGHNTSKAAILLRTFEDLQAIHVADRDRLRKELAAPGLWKKVDIYDGKPWTEMDVRDLTAAIVSGDTIEEAASHICRSGTVDDVRRKAEELGLVK